MLSISEIQDFFGLKNQAFISNCNPDFYFEGYDHIEALNRLLYLIEEGNMNFGMLTGEIGCGKTMTRQVLKRKLNQKKFEVIDSDNCNVPFNFLMMDVMERLVHQPEDVPNGDENLYFLLKKFRFNLDAKIRCQNKSLVLIFDEAQQLSSESLIELKNLTNIDSDCEMRLTIILVGQPELRENVKKLPQIDQRVSLRFHLNPLSPSDVHHYIKTRLLKAGHPNGRVFDSESLDFIAHQTRGVPREINRVCKLSMDLAYTKHVRSIDVDIVKSILFDLKRQQGIF